MFYLSFQELKRQVIKKYDYIYTGQNDDVLDFNIKFDTAFFAAITPFGGRDSAGNKTEDEDDIDLNPMFCKIHQNKLNYGRIDMPFGNYDI